MAKRPANAAPHYPVWLSPQEAKALLIHQLMHNDLPTSIIEKIAAGAYPKGSGDYINLLLQDLEFTK